MSLICFTYLFVVLQLHCYNLGLIFREQVLYCMHFALPLLSGIIVVERNRISFRNKNKEKIN